MSDHLSVTPIMPGFVAKVEFDVANASASDIAFIKEVMKEYSVLVMNGQTLTHEDQMRFAENFGPLDQVPAISRNSEGSSPATRFNRQQSEEELDAAKQMLATLGTTVWHTDGTYKSVPAHLSMLYGIEVTAEGGETQFADARAAYRDLPQNLKTMVDGLVAEHSTLHAAFIVGATDMSEENLADFKVTQAYDLVRTLPESGQKTIYISAHAARVIGLPVPQGRMILRELTERVTAPHNTYTHKWTPGDFLIWDNRCTMHRLRPYRTSDRRVLQRVSTADTEYHPRDPDSVNVSPEVFEAL